MQRNPVHKPDVIIVGAGPVGLLTAIQTKLYDPAISILMLEKYSEYQRRHALNLDARSFYDAHPDPDLQALIKSLPDSIRTNELEDLLLAFAKKLGIVIETKNEVKDCKKLPQEYPAAKVIVGADGSHSIVHKEIFDHKYQIQKTMQYIAEVKYDASGEAFYLDKFKESIPATTYAKHFISEHVGKLKDGKTPIAIRIFCNQATYEKMKGATFKNPYRLSDWEKIDPDLYKSIKAWLTAREEFTGEKRVKDSELVTMTNLPIYASEEFVKERGGVIWFLVGDAAFGVPYFRSLNNGILCSSQLANVIAAIINDHRMEEKNSFKFSTISKVVQTPQQYYKNYVQGLVIRELLVAEFKNFGVNVAESSAAISQVIPVSRMSLLKSEQGKNYKTRMGANEPKKGLGSLFSIFKKREPERPSDKTQFSCSFGH